MIIRALLATLLVGAALAAWWLLRQQQASPATRPVPARTAPPPGYVARQAHLVETGPDGAAMYVVDASTISQPPGSPVVELTEVRLSFHDQGGRDWSARADQGRILNDASQVSLSGSVVVTGPLDGEQPPARIDTDHLEVNTREQVITTDAPVALSWSGQQLHGRGLLARLKIQFMRLESDVHGRFTP